MPGLPLDFVIFVCQKNVFNLCFSSEITVRIAGSFYDGGVSCWVNLVVLFVMPHKWSQFLIPWEQECEKANCLFPLTDEEICIYFLNTLGEEGGGGGGARKETGLIMKL